MQCVQCVGGYTQDLGKYHVLSVIFVIHMIHIYMVTAIYYFPAMLVCSLINSMLTYKVVAGHDVSLYFVFRNCQQLCEEI